MRSLLCILLILGINSLSSAQNRRINVGVSEFRHASSVEPGYASQAFNITNSYLSNSKRLLLIEIAQKEVIDQRIYAEGAEEYIGADLIELAPEGTEYLILGHVSRANASPDKNNGFNSAVEFSIRKVSIGTQTIACSHSFKGEVGSLGSRAVDKLLGLGEGASNALAGRDTKESAIQTAFEQIEKSGDFDAFLNKCFPLEFGIISVEKKDKKDRPEEIVIEGGSNWGLKKGTRLYVIRSMTRETLAGETQEYLKKIGEITVKEVQGEDFSLCKVNEGKTGMREAFKEDPTGVIVSTFNPAGE